MSLLRLSDQMRQRFLDGDLNWPRVEENEPRPAKFETKARFRPWPDEDVTVVALWYPEPHNCWRVEVQSYDGDLGNMTVEQAASLGRALIAAAGVSP